MKRYATALMAMAASCSLAQEGGYLGTKVGNMTTASGDSSGVGPFIQMVLALGIVLLLLKTVAPKLVNKLNKRLVTTATSALNIEETASFAGGTLYIIRAKAKTLLVCVSASGVTCLGDLTEEGRADEAPPTFQDLVETATPYEPAKAAVEAEAAEGVQAALARLERLSR